MEMKKRITLVSATFGSLDITVKENLNYPNTIEIGDKRIDFSEIVPQNMDIREKDYHIIIYDGIKAYCEIIVGNETYTGTIHFSKVKTEEIIAY